MATDAQPLITLGPFYGLDTKASQEIEKPGFAVVSSNVDTSRNVGALMTARGRTQYGNFPMLGPNNPIAALARLDVGPNLCFYIAQGANSPYITGYWCPQSGASGTLPYIAIQWIRGVQFQGALFLDSGHQINHIGGANPLVSSQWHYFAPTGGYGATLVSSTTPLEAATYSYAFVRVYSVPQENRYAYQQSTPYYLPTNAQYSTNEYGTVTYTPGTLVTQGNTAIRLYGDFYGFTPDGIAYSTDVYRMSSNSNVFNYLFSISGSNPEFVDTFTDAQIAANQQLVINRDPPPTGITDLGPNGLATNNTNPIESLQDRMWVLAREVNANNYNVPQTQLWYSQVGQGWSFDAALQVTLVSQESTTNEGVTSPGLVPQGYGNQPTAIKRIGSQMLVWGQQSTSVLYGTDETNYTILPLFQNVGCVAPLSPVQIREGIVGWLSAIGAFIYNQIQLVDVTSEQLRNFLDTIPAEHWYAAVSSFRRNVWFLSFPLDNITLTAYFPTVNGQIDYNQPRWGSLPYATSATAWNSAYLKDTSAANPKFEQIVSARYGTNFIDFWSDTDSDLGDPISLTWTSPLQTGKESWGQQTFRTVAIVAPAQPTTCTITLTIDPGFPSSQTPWTSGVIDLSVAPVTKIINIPNGACKGYAAQVTINATNNGSQPVEIWEVVVGGTVDRTWVVNA